MRTLLTFLLGATITLAPAQTEVTFASRKFSPGLQPTFVVRLENVERSEVEAWFKKSLKDISAEVKDKKEVMATGARIPAATGDTLAILFATDQRSKTDPVVAHFAFRIDNTFVNSDSEARRIEGCRTWVYDQAVAYKKHVATDLLQAAERDLKGVRMKLEDQQRDQKRMELGIERNTKRSEDAAADKVNAVSELKLADERVNELQSSTAANPTDEQIKALNSALKDQKKLQERITKLDSDGVDARLKVTDLQEQLALNAQAQESQRQAILAQEQVVEERKKVLEEIK
jgi:hypothetical protein